VNNKRTSFSILEVFMKPISLAALILVFVFALSSWASGQMQSANFRMITTVMSGGGSRVGSGSFQGNSTIGQPSPLASGDNPQSFEFDMFPGFWYAAEGGVVFCPGDYDRDNDVDGMDLAAFADYYWSNDPEADLNGDSFVDEEDIEKFAENFGKRPCA